MAFDDNAVRIELHKVMQMGRTTSSEGGEAKTSVGMVARDAAFIFPMKDGKSTGRKPAGKLIGDSPAGVLRDIADWIEANNDPSLTKLLEEMAKLD